MVTSGTTAFNPPIGTLTLNAFSRCGVKRTELLAEHMENAYLEANLLQADWGSDGITWWTVSSETVPLVQGTPTYTVLPNVVSVLDVYISNGSSNRLIFPFSRTDYASLAEPMQQGFPTSFWWDRVIPSTLTLWPVPDGSATYEMTYYYYSQIQDANLRQGGSAQVPYFWLNAYTADLAHRLARIYAPALEAARKADRDEAYMRANKQTELAQMYISVGLSGYYR